MTKHKEIQNPENFGDKDYKRFEYLLFAEDTPTEIIEEIVMTLAHLPTKRAQNLLNRFKDSVNAQKIDWLEPAMDEGNMLYIMPNGEQEERDFIAIKLYHKNEDHIVRLMGECDRYAYLIRQYEIEMDALKAVQKESTDEEEKKEIGYQITALSDLITMDRSHLHETEKEIAMQEKINEKIKAGIKTERYKKLSAADISGFHFDGED